MEIRDHLQSTLGKLYAIEHELTGGGMARVFAGREVALDRRVVIKMLPAENGAQVSIDRFKREIALAARLQHPHIVPVLAAGDADGAPYYTMPLVEGESLRARLARVGELPIGEAVSVLKEVARALAYAHERGIIHRDIKPDNVMLSGGVAMVTDFGVAKALSASASEIGTPATQVGMALGTPAYMAPEQVAADPGVDHRADLYAFGCLAYELIAGQPPFSGRQGPAMLAAQVSETPEFIGKRRPSTPGALAALVMQCLEKRPADRPQSALEVLRMLDSAVLTPNVTQATTIGGLALAAARGRWSFLRFAPWALSVMLLGWLLVMRASVAEHSPPTARFSIDLPDSLRVASMSGSELALSRDGSQLVFAGTVGRSTLLHVRRFDDQTIRTIPGTEGGSPRFSPDGNWILFHQRGALKKIRTTGGASIVVVDSSSEDSSWGDGDQIVYIWRRELRRASAAGGPSVLLAIPDTARGHLRYGLPDVLPGGKAALVTIWKGTTDFSGAHLGVVSLATGQVDELGVRGSHPQWVSTGHLLFRGSDSAAFAAPFSLRRLRTSGAPVPVLDGVGTRSGGAMDVAVSRNGTLVFQTAGSDGHIVAVDHQGRETLLSPALRGVSQLRVSPDGKRIAMQMSGDVWTYEVGSQMFSRVTTDSSSGRPEWTPDGKRLAIYRTFRAPSDGQRALIVSRPWDGTGREDTLATHPRGVFNISLGVPHGHHVIRVGGPANTTELWLLPVDSPKSVRPIFITPTRGEDPRQTPDGRVLAHTSQETGRSEIYLRSLSGADERVIVSRDGGMEPSWGPDGRTLYYRGPTHIMAASVVRSPRLAVLARTPLFADRYLRCGQSWRCYDVLPGGEGFVFLRPTARRVLAVVNWSEELRRLMTASGPR